MHEHTSGGGASFLAMWVAMMAPMMLPSFIPMLWRYRNAVASTSETQLNRLTALVTAGYFFVWTVVGMAVLLAGASLASIEMPQPALSQAIPIAAGALVFAAGTVQFSAWKARQLACCRQSGHGGVVPPGAGSAWRHGVRLGLHCVGCCGNLMAILLIVGIMDLRAMAAVTAALTAERFASDGQRVARGIGVVVLGLGAFLVARAAGFA